MGGRVRSRRASIAAIGALLLGAGAAPGVHPVLAQERPELVRSLLERRVVVDGHFDADTQVARGYVVFEQPLPSAFRLLSQTGRQMEFRPDLDSLETLEWFEDGSIEEHRMQVFFLDIRYRLRNRFDAAQQRIWWELAPGFENDLERLDGFWELYALEDGRTLGVFGTAVELGPGMPSFLLDYVTRRNLPRTLERCRRWVDADGAAGP